MSTFFSGKNKHVPYRMKTAGDSTMSTFSKRLPPIEESGNSFVVHHEKTRHTQERERINVNVRLSFHTFKHIVLDFTLNTYKLYITQTS